VLPLLPVNGSLCILLEPTRIPHTVDVAGITYLTIGRGAVDSDRR
jgi:hypothetical protein